RRCFTSSGSDEAPTSNRSSTAVETLLTFWPPGPDARTNRSEISLSSIAIVSLTRSIALERVEAKPELVQPVHREHEPAAVLGAQDGIHLLRQQPRRLRDVDVAAIDLGPGRDRVADARNRRGIGIGRIDRHRPPDAQRVADRPLTPVDPPDEEARA